MFRVRLDGDDLDDAAKDALSGANAWWEGTRSAPSEPFHHRVLVEANTGEGAIRMVQATMALRGKFSGFSATPVTNSNDEVWRGPFYRRWEEIDWDATPERAQLSDLERGVLFALAQTGIPTYKVVEDPDVPTTHRAEVEAALESLRGRNLVYSTHRIRRAPC